MRQQDEENTAAILEYPFDYDRYIQESLRKIDDLDERRFAKTVLLEGLGEVIKCMEKKYQELEKRVYEEIEIKEYRYETVTTVIKKEHFDPVNMTLFPVISEEMEKEYIKEAASPEKGVYLGTVFLKTDEAKGRQFLEEGIFRGHFLFGEEKKKALFKIYRTEQYRNQIELLYKVFQDNRIPWETIHTGMLDKFYDVFLIGFEDETYEGEEKEEWTGALGEADICWGEFKPFICYGMMPLWNIERIYFDSTDFMLPCIDGIYYEHEFILPDGNCGDGYLIDPNEDILEIRHEKGKIIIKSKKETFENWQALHIVQKETIRSLHYTEPFLTNHRKDSFFKRMQEKNRIKLMTKTDLFRRIMELDIREYIEIDGYEICDDAVKNFQTEGMNWFVQEELFPMGSRKKLILKFKEKNKGHYLNDSMVRYVVSQIQMEINEYQCVGAIE